MALGNKVGGLDDLSSLINNKSNELEKAVNMRSAKLSDAETIKLDKIMIAMHTENTSKAIRACINYMWKMQENEINKIIEENKNNKTLELN